jgi:O-antigen/teichoic acid export membrane protein
MSKPFSQGAVAKAVLLMTGSTYVSFFFGLLVSAIIARGVGPSDFGRYSYVVWMSGLLVMLANNGLNTTGIRFVSESLGRGDAPAAGAVHGWLARWQFASLAIVGTVFLLLSPLALPANWTAPLTVFVGVVLLSTAAKCLYVFDISIAKGHGQFKVEAVSTVTLSALNFVAVGLLYAFHAPMLSYLLLFAATSVCYYIVAFQMRRSRKIVSSSQGMESGMARRVRHHLMWTVVLTLAATLSNKAAETYLLNAFVGSAEVGFFAIGAALARGGVELLAAGVNSVLMPLMAHGYGQGGAARVNAILADSVRLYGFGGLLLAGVGFFWADVVVWLMYGDNFHQAANVFRVMIVVAGLTLSQSAFGALLTTTDNQRIRAAVALLSVVVSASAAFLLVPRFGLPGAVLSYAMSSTVIYFVMCIGIVKVFSVSLPWKELSRLLLAAALAGPAAAALLWVSASLMMQFWAGVLFTMVYVGSTIGFRAWRPADYTKLRPLAERYPKVFGRTLLALERWAGS